MVCSFRPSNGRKGIIEDIIDLFQSRKGKKEQAKKKSNKPTKLYTKKPEIIINYYININELNSPMNTTSTTRHC